MDAELVALIALYVLGLLIGWAFGDEITDFLRSRGWL